MTDETMRPILYQFGRAERLWPLGLAVFWGLSAALLLWASGGFLWPWGIGFGGIALLGAIGALARWRWACRSILWDEERQTLQWDGWRRRTIPWSDLVSAQTIPASAFTRLKTRHHRYRISHRLVRADDLLHRLRARCPQIFPHSNPPVYLRRSRSSLVIQLGLAMGTGWAGTLMAPWAPALGWGLGAAAAYVALRVGLFIPRAFRVDEGRLTVLYWLRWKHWGRPRGIRDEGYGSGGALFYRMVFDYGRWTVVLDEAHLRDPLRPLSDEIFHLLLRPPGS